jgi:hypothetical protein
MGHAGEQRRDDLTAQCYNGETLLARLKRSFKAREVADLLTLYGVMDQHQGQTLLALAVEVNAADWAHCYRGLLPRWARPS